MCVPSISNMTTFFRGFPPFLFFSFFLTHVTRPSLICFHVTRRQFHDGRINSCIPRFMISNFRVNEKVYESNLLSLCGEMIHQCASSTTNQQSKRICATFEHQMVMFYKLCTSIMYYNACSHRFESAIITTRSTSISFQTRQIILTFN